MGYDLQEAGYRFEVTGNEKVENAELLRTIAEDFVKAARQKAGLVCNDRVILSRFNDFLPKVTAAEPILILYIDGEANFDLKFINRTNPLFHNLFVEDLA